jgi:hypothetical protein
MSCFLHSQNFPWNPHSLLFLALFHCAVLCYSVLPPPRLFAAKGLRMVNPLLPRDADTGKIGPPPPLQTPVPRLSHEDKWLLYRRTRRCAAATRLWLVYILHQLSASARSVGLSASLSDCFPEMCECHMHHRAGYTAGGAWRVVSWVPKPAAFVRDSRSCKKIIVVMLMV